MKTMILATMLGLLAVLPAQAQKGTLEFPKPPPTKPPPPHDYVVDPPPPRLTNPPPAGTTTYVYDQKPLEGRAPLISIEQATTIIDRFKSTNANLGNPRYLLYVNRELVNEQGGMKLIRRNERVESTRSGTNTATIKSTGENTYRTEAATPPSLADRQTVRDVERLFGRPFRAAGATLADQRVAAQLISDRPLDDFIGTTDTPEARRDRAALGRIADIVVEILIASKTMAVETVSGTQQITVPDIQATAIRLSDARILGQAASSDITGSVPPAALANYNVREVTEATALALMDDMTQ